MIDERILSLLKETLSRVKAASDKTPDLQSVIVSYETAIEKAENNKYFSLPKTCAGSLDPDIVSALEAASLKTEQYFQDLLRSYVGRRIRASKLEANIRAFVRHPEIYEEFVNYLLAGERFEKTAPVMIKGYTAERLARETILTPLGAFNYLVSLKEKPEEAFGNLQRGLPRK